MQDIPAIVDENTVLETLRTVKDPELDRNIVELGLIHEVDVEGDHVWVYVVPTNPYCPFAKELTESIREAIAALPGVKTVHVEWGSDG